MISTEVRQQVRRLFYVNHFTVHAISQTLNVHRDTVSSALELDRKKRSTPFSEVDRFDSKIRDTLVPYPKIQGTRIYSRSTSKKSS